MALLLALPIVLPLAVVLLVRWRRRSVHPSNVVRLRVVTVDRDSNPPRSAA